MNSNSLIKRKRRKRFATKLFALFQVRVFYKEKSSGSGGKDYGTYI
ncbi:hypothetical protein QY95_00345 [Bacillus thermotolerans]|uniref:Uncharacterized protein n=1 Tax=Bacillus thermotolerans TaxID=1221996 RepID=A0A0F5IAD3_BACTR|nr:hypothetical protein QY95_00345 [Bacillus thermotolerans]